VLCAYWSRIWYRSLIYAAIGGGSASYVRQRSQYTTAPPATSRITSAYAQAASSEAERVRPLGGSSGDYAKRSNGDAFRVEPLNATRLPTRCSQCALGAVVFFWSGPKRAATALALDGPHSVRARALLTAVPLLFVQRESGGRRKWFCATSARQPLIAACVAPRAPLLLH